MACSAKQRESNKRNASKSTGPKSASGRRASASNSYVHGLTGAGVVLPIEDAQEVDRRFARLQAEMKPKTEMAGDVLFRIALLTLKLKRSSVQETKAISSRMRSATAKFDDARLAEVEKLHAWIAAEPVTNARRLRSSPEGIDLLIRKIEALLSDLDHPQGARWGWQHCDQLHHLLGLRRDEVPVSRAKALTEAIAGNFQHLDDTDRPELVKIDRQCWAANRLLLLIEAELAKLKTLREGLDYAGLELDRVEAPLRAMFDDSKEAVLARKYEAANERAYFRALREFHELQANYTEVEIPEELEADPAEELGSLIPEPSGDEAEAADIDMTVPTVVLPAIKKGSKAVQSPISTRDRSDFDPSPRE